DRVARVREDPGALLQEREGFLQRETASDRVVGTHSIPERRIDPGGVSQGQQQVFLEVLAEMAGRLRPPLRSGTAVSVKTELERRIVPGSNEEKQLPVIHFIGGRFFQTETERKASLGRGSGEVRSPGAPALVIVQRVSRCLRRDWSGRIETPVEQRIG